MDSKEQMMVALKHENDFLKMENEMLKREFIRLTGGYPTIDQMSGNVIFPQINNNNHRNGNSNSTHTDNEVEKLKEENFVLKKGKETADRQNTNLLNENMILAAKLNNLENVFIGSNIIRERDGSVSNDAGDNYNMSAVKNVF
jgi:hypothetical protein